LERKKKPFPKHSYEEAQSPLAGFDVAADGSSSIITRQS
jgi:hypothetical protein